MLELAEQYPFARRIVNSGRLSVPATLARSSLNTPDTESFAGSAVPGAPALDAPVKVEGRDAWFLDCLPGEFTVVHFGGAPVPAALDANGIRVRVLQAGRDFTDAAGPLAKRYDARDGTTYLFRPDQHVCARWRQYDAAAIGKAVGRATCNA